MNGIIRGAPGIMDGLGDTIGKFALGSIDPSGAIFGGEGEMAQKAIGNDRTAEPAGGGEIAAIRGCETTNASKESITAANDDVVKDGA